LEFRRVLFRSLLERGDHAPQERRGAEERRQHRRDVHTHPAGDVPPGVPAPQPLRLCRGGRDRHHITSIRRTARRMAIAAASRIGNMNRAVAAPCPKLPPSKPRKNAQLVSTWVVLFGPPRVSTSTTAKSVKVNTTPN